MECTLKWRLRGRYGGRFDAASEFGILMVLVAFALAANYAVLQVDRRLNHWAA